VHMVLSGKTSGIGSNTSSNNRSAANSTNGQGIAIKKVTNVFSKKILAKRALREIKLLQHFRGMSPSLS
jgi:hypothetical protein